VAAREVVTVVVQVVAMAEERVAAREAAMVVTKAVERAEVRVVAAMVETTA